MLVITVISPIPSNNSTTTIDIKTLPLHLGLYFNRLLAVLSLPRLPSLPTNSSPQSTNRLHAPLNHRLNPRPQRVVRTLDIQILQPDPRNKAVKLDLNTRDRDALGVQSLERGLVFGADLVCATFIHGFVVCQSGLGAIRGVRWVKYGRARVWDRTDGVLAELRFEEEHQACEACGRVGSGVGVVLGFLWLVGVGVRVRMLAGGFCGQC